MSVCNIVLAGVGGQGVLLFAEILGEAAVKEGFNVRVSEIHGMAQRGGAVVSEVRVGEAAVSPMVLEGTANAIVGLEPMEALRSIKYANEKTLVLVNSEIVYPGGISVDTVYPSLERILDGVRLFTKNIITVDASAEAKSLGNANVMNAVMLGALSASGVFPVKLKAMRESMMASVSARFVDVNLRAFDAGVKAVSGGR